MLTFAVSNAGSSTARLGMHAVGTGIFNINRAEAKNAKQSRQAQMAEAELDRKSVV